ncbi:hypothetical protein EDC04DRAFT_3140145 [Pisolithus marmoratus]|nr:hypothetical protein EDC04DRAFT_3140145 [Pisolithus marmoratus]
MLQAAPGALYLRGAKVSAVAPFIPDIRSFDTGDSVRLNVGYKKRACSRALALIGAAGLIVLVVVRSGMVDNIAAQHIECTPANRETIHFVDASTVLQLGVWDLPPYFEISSRHRSPSVSKVYTG